MSDELPDIGTVECVRCGTEHDRDDTHEHYSGRLYCPDCVTSCEYCGDTMPTGEIVGADYHGNDFCQGCLDEGELVYCDDIEDYVSTQYDHYYVADLEVWYFHADNLYYDERSQEYVSERPDDGPIHPYDTDVLDYVRVPRTLYQRDQRPFMGFELEFEAEGSSYPETMVEDVMSQSWASLNVCFKHDGSLDNGAEMVTGPHQLAWWHKHKDDVHKAVRTLIGHGARSGSTGTCGMHIHVGRRQISALTQGKILVAMNTSRHEAREFYTAIAQRDVNTWCKQDRYAKVSDAKKRSAEKYRIVHITERTLEFRLFRGNLRISRVMKNLEFVAAMIDWCGQTSIRDLDSYEKFFEFLSSNRKAYPHLWSFIIEKRIFTMVITNNREAA